MTQHIRSFLCLVLASGLLSACSADSGFVYQASHTLNPDLPTPGPNPSVVPTDSPIVPTPGPTNPPIDIPGSIEVSPNSLIFECSAGSADVLQKGIQVRNVTGSPLSEVAFTVSESLNAVSVTPISSSTPRDLMVQVDCDSMSDGETTSGSVLVRAVAPATGQKSVSLQIQKKMPPPALRVSPTELDYACPAGGADVQVQTLTVSSTQASVNFDATLSESIASLGLSRPSGHTEFQVQASVSCAAVGDGADINSFILISASSPGQGQVSVPVQIQKASSSPHLDVSPSSLSYVCDAGQTTSISRLIAVRSTNLTEFNFHATENLNGGSGISQDPFSLSPSIAGTPRDLTATLDCGKLSDGATISGVIAIQAYSPGIGQVEIPVQIEKRRPVPQLIVSPLALAYTCPSGSTADISKSVTVSSSISSSNFPFTVAHSLPYLTFNPTGGQTPTSVVGTVHCGQMDNGAYASGDVTISAASPGTGSLPIAVTISKESPGLYTDSFDQDYQGAVDILWVIDSSGSMEQEQTAIAANADLFLSKLTQATVDFRIGVITTDPERNDGYGLKSLCSGTTSGILYPIPTNPDLLKSRFKSCVQVGTDGSGREEGIEASRRAVDPNYVLGARNPGFPRKGGIPFHVVYVSDEEDEVKVSSFDSYEYFNTNVRHYITADMKEALEEEMTENLAYANDHGRTEDDKEAYYPLLANHLNFFQNTLMGNPQKFRAHAITMRNLNGPVGSCNRRTTEEEVGQRYQNFSIATGGISDGDVCSNNWGSVMDNLGLQAAGLNQCFTLTRTPSSMSPLSITEVVVNGAAVTNPGGWEYQSATNQVCLSTIPGAGSTIIVRYY